MIRSPFRALSALVLAALPGVAGATTYTWPNLTGVGACTGTLQACVNGTTAGDVVQIGADDLIFPDRYTFIDESIAINRGITLRAATGIDPVFAAGREIVVDTFAAGEAQLAIQGLVFLRGNIQVRHRATGEGTFRIERNRFVDVTPALCAIQFTGESGAPRGIAIIGDNVIRTQPRSGGPSSGICVSSNALARQDVVFRNRIEPAVGTLAFGVVIVGLAGGPVTVQGNSIVGGAFTTGIQVGAFQLTARYVLQLDDNVVAGQLATPATVAASVLIVSDNIDATITNNTLVHGFKGLEVEPAGIAPSIAGRIDNNVIAFHASEGLVLAPAAAGVTNRNNLVFANAANAYTPGPATLTVDPMLEQPLYPRPRPGSPTANAGNTASVPPFASFDADGEPRVALGAVDIGAYEATGDFGAVEGGSTIGNQLRLVNLEPLLVTGDRIQITTRRTASGALLRQTLGVYDSTIAGWRAFFENPALTMPSTFAVNAMVPVGGNAGVDHLSTAGNSFDETTQIDIAALNSRPFAIATVTHRYPDGAGGAADYHDHPLGLEYFGTRWLIRNQDLAGMQFNHRFNLMVAPVGSPIAFRVRAAGAFSELRVDHPVLDDNACALFVASRVDDPDDAVRLANPVPFTVEYRAGVAGAPGRWFIVAEGDGPPTFPSGAAFNVIIDGESSNRCRAPVLDDLFANGFE